MKNKFLTKAKLQKMQQQIRRNQQGSVLIEAMIAVLIFSFGILAIAGLQGAMMKNTADATFRSEAAYVVQQRMGELLVAPLALGSGGQYPIASLPNGSLTVTGLSNSRLRFRVTWQTPGENQHSYEATTSVFLARQPV
jgi:type IV pilus assembly protein PilV